MKARVFLAVVHSVSACTTIAIGKDANLEGAPIVTHTNDCADCDFRVGFIPRMHHAPSARRPVGQAFSQYPRRVDNVSAAIYDMDVSMLPKLVREQLIPVATLPQVSETNAIFDANYPILNHHGLMMGESTCSAKLQGLSIPLGGECMFSVSSLMSLASERCATAREAIVLMGTMAQQHGFYSGTSICFTSKINVPS